MMSLNKIVSPIFDIRKIAHSFYGKNNGFSNGLYQSLNCSKYVDDNNIAVLKNLKLIKTDINAKKLITMKQIHGTYCLQVNKNISENIIIEADALVTTSAKIALGILTADCVPILFADEQNGIIAAAHAGWRSAVDGIIQKTIKKMKNLGAHIQNIKVAIGPSIQQESYEVQNDFILELSKNTKLNFQNFIKENNAKKYFNLPLYCKDILLNAGISFNNISPEKTNQQKDTYKLSDEYFSYRYARENFNGICGRQISAICLIT